MRPFGWPVVVMTLFVVGCGAAGPPTPNTTAVTTPPTPATPSPSDTGATATLNHRAAPTPELIKPDPNLPAPPDDVPLPEGAVVFANHENVNGLTVVAQQATESDYTRLSKFFLAELPKHGWEIHTIPDSQQILNQWSIKITKDQRVGTVATYVEPSRVGCTIHYLIQTPSIGRPRRKGSDK